MAYFRRFLVQDDGAVTVDWVVLTAAVVVLSVAVGSALTDPINTEINQIASVVTDTN